ncbi:MAG TPA: hypothetical protein VG734_09980 [Lacunisphaera sp.]|nr:hypothetical protein [Lacunisphaera sp.]
MRVIAYIEKHRLFVPEEAFTAAPHSFPSFTYLGMNADRSKVIVLLPDKGLFVAVEREPYRVITGPLVGDCLALGSL